MVESASNLDSKSNLSRLAPELVLGIVSYLTNRDIKSLRLACKALSYKASLRIERVFLSANPRNIEVCRAIADHEVLRHRVHEIIWDDARLDKGTHPKKHFLRIYCARTNAYVPVEPPLGNVEDGVPDWFEYACKKNVGGTQERADWVSSWKYFHQLYLQQEEVLKHSSDANVLGYALERFTSLRKITITCAAHGVWGAPLYYTPMIRAFPPGFNYPVPIAWPLNEPDGTRCGLGRWSDKEERKRWRGFQIIMHELAKKTDHHVSEFIIDTNHFRTGLSCRVFHVFKRPCDEYDHFVDLLRRPGFSHLDLPLLANGQWEDKQDWSCFRNGYLRKALAQATDLQHFSLQLEADFEQFYDPSREALARSFIPLHSMLPVEKWQNLQHFGLSGFLVTRDDLISLLALLPITLRTVKLDTLRLMGETYTDLLDDMRNKLNWRERPKAERPKVTIRYIFDYSAPYVSKDDVIDEFLYGDEEISASSWSLKDWMDIEQSVFDSGLYNFAREGY